MGLFRMIARLFVSERTQTTTYQTPLRPEPELQISKRTVSVTVIEAVAEVQGRAWVVDGDTIDIYGKRIRLAGIDAPELDHPYGKNAKFALLKLCQGQRVRAVFDGLDAYQRNVATCYLPDGRDLSAEMVKLGMAIDWPKFSGGKYQQYEVDGIRRKLWRCDARQKGRMPPPERSQG